MVHEFFVAVKEGIDEMIKFLANEPSLGLFFVQQHAHTSMPYLIGVEDKFEEKIHEVNLHTEDIKDSICAVKSITEYGIPIADEMIKEMNKSLLVLASTRAKTGLISNQGISTNHQNILSRNNRNGQQVAGSKHNYLSALFSSTKQKWPQTDAVPTESKSNQLLSLTPSTAQLSDAQLDGCTATKSLCDIPSVIENFDKFKSVQEVKLEEWLQETKPAEGHGD